MQHVSGSNSSFSLCLLHTELVTLLKTLTVAVGIEQITPVVVVITASLVHTVPVVGRHTVASAAVESVLD